MGFILGYGAHCFKLYGIRAWIVAFWTFVSKTRAAVYLQPDRGECRFHFVGDACEHFR